MFTHILSFLSLCFAIVNTINPGKTNEELKDNELPRFRCDYNYIAAIDGFVKFHEIPANWKEARLRCHLEGAYLASPLNQELHDVMHSMILVPAIFTGIHATFSNGDYFSNEGVPLRKIPHKWQYSEPDNLYDNENCLVMYSNGTLGDFNCERAFPYICYKKRDELVVNECGTVDNEYTLDTRTNSCYKFHTVPRIWSRAFMACAAEGGHLVIINSKQEAQVLIDLFQKHLAGSMVGRFWKDVAFVGVQDWGEHGEWLTIEGQTLKDAGYDVFEGGEWNNSTDGEFCGSIYRSGKFNDLWCNRPAPFICEKSPSFCD